MLVRTPSPAIRGVAVAAALLAGAAGAGCASGADGSGAARPADDRPLVVTTVSPITNIVANVAGDAVRVVGVVPEGENSHEFEPAPSLARTLAEADLVVVNGLGLEEPTIALAEANLADGAEIVRLGDRALERDEWVFDFSFPEEAGDPNPHLWTSPVLAKELAAIVADELAELVPAEADAIERRHAAFAAKLDALDAATRAATATVPAGRRKLLTYHDSFPYFAREYGWEVIGAIQPSDFKEPTAREVADLIAQVRSAGVPAIFGSEVFPSPVLEQIGREAGVRYVDTLRDDDLPGEPGDPEHSYLGLMRLDLVTMVEALGGDAAALHALDVSDLEGTEAEYAG